MSTGNPVDVISWDDLIHNSYHYIFILLISITDAMHAATQCYYCTFNQHHLIIFIIVVRCDNTHLCILLFSYHHHHYITYSLLSIFIVVVRCDNTHLWIDIVFLLSPPLYNIYTAKYYTFCHRHHRHHHRHRCVFIFILLIAGFVSIMSEILVPSTLQETTFSLYNLRTLNYNAGQNYFSW